MLNSAIWIYETCFVGKVCGPLWSTWGAPLGEGKSGVKAGIVTTPPPPLQTPPPCNLPPPPGRPSLPCFSS